MALFKDVGPFEPHVIAHEFSHRKGYWTELPAQALAYLSLASSGEPVLVQSALLERLHRNLRVLSGYDDTAFRRLVDATVRRRELRAALGTLRPRLGPVARRVEEGMRHLYDGACGSPGRRGSATTTSASRTSSTRSRRASPRARRRQPPAGSIAPRRSRPDAGTAARAAVHTRGAAEKASGSLFPDAGPRAEAPRNGS